MSPCDAIIKDMKKHLNKYMIHYCIAMMVALGCGISIAMGSTWGFPIGMLISLVIFFALIIFVDFTPSDKEIEEYLAKRKLERETEENLAKNGE